MSTKAMDEQKNTPAEYTDALTEYFFNWCYQASLPTNRSADDMLADHRQGRLALTGPQEQFLLAFVTVWEGINQ